MIQCLCDFRIVRSTVVGEGGDTRTGWVEREGSFHLVGDIVLIYGFTLWREVLFVFGA